MTFVGRVPELDELERALAAARAGRGRTVLLAGEAGIGKSRLAAELARRAGDAGFELLLGRSIDFAGSELPYLPFADALGDIGEAAAGSQLRVFRGALDAIARHARAAPVLLQLEDLHWADTSTLDLLAFLAHNIDDLPVLLLATCRADEPESAVRMRRLAEGVRRSGTGVVLELGPFDVEEIATLLDARSDGPVPAALVNAIAARSEGNPFFAEELLAAAGDASGALPRGLRETLTARVAGLDERTRDLLRVAAVAGRDIAYPLLRAVAALPERDVRDALRQAVDHGVLVADRDRARFRHALLAEAIYATILPGEREELHERVAEELASSGAEPGELAPHWAAAGRASAALVASVEAAREAETVFGFSEARSHLERALALWDAVPDAPALVDLRLDELCARAAELASRTGNAPRAVELTRRAIALVGDGDRLRAALLHERLGGYLFERGAGDTFLAAVERAVELVPAEPPSAELARVLTTLAVDLSLLWRYDESIVVGEEALALARTVGAREVELRALGVLGIDLAYLGRGEEGLAALEEARGLAETTGDPAALQRAYVALTDVLTMLGRPRDAARVAQEGLDAVRPYEDEHTVLTANRIEALLAIGEWDAADRESAAALRAITANYPHMALILRADLELGRGRFDAARARLDAARATVRHEPGVATLQGYVADLALWERRWADAEEAVRSGLELARPAWGAQIRVWLCAKGLRAQAELAALARARGEEAAGRADDLLAVARHAAADARAITPNAGGWLALAEAEHARARAEVTPELWAGAASRWDRLERPAVAAYCRWRQADSLVAAGASRVAATEPLRAAHAVAGRLGAQPLARELKLLAQRARLDVTPPDPRLADARDSLESTLGLTAREAEVLTLVARGYTNREIAAALVISVKTASVHVSHILDKLRVPNRREAAAVAHRLAPPPIERAPDP